MCRSLPPSTTPVPASTSPSPWVSTSSGSLSPFARPVAPVGRSKEQRWTDVSPSPPAGPAVVDSEPGAAGSASGVSYKVALLSAPASPASPVRERAAQPPKRIRILRRGPSPPPPRRSVDAEGWQKVWRRKVSRRSAVRRPAPSDLHGKCFNCFSPNHRAAACRLPPRCFSCLRLGHRAAVCPGEEPARAIGDRVPAWKRLDQSLLHVPSEKGRESVWRRVAGLPPPATVLADRGAASRRPVWQRISSVPAVKSASGGCQEAGGGSPPGGRKRRRHSRRRGRAHSSRHGDSEGADTDCRLLMPESTAVQGGAVQHASRELLGILDFNQCIAREEISLRRALFVSIVGTRPTVQAEEVREEIASALGFEASLLLVHKSWPEDFLMIFPDEAMASRAYNNGELYHAPRFSLKFRRWTRFAHATGDSLPTLVEVVLRGIPAHAWDRSTAELLLRDSCHVLELHPATASKLDLSAFRLQAWCHDPASLRRSGELFIVEPSVAAGRSAVPMQGLCYHIDIEVTPVLEESVGDDALPPPPVVGGPSGDGGAAAAPRGRGYEGAPRRSVHDRLGGSRSASGHVAGSSSARGTRRPWSIPVGVSHDGAASSTMICNVGPDPASTGALGDGQLMEEATIHVDLRGVVPCSPPFEGALEIMAYLGAGGSQFVGPSHAPGPVVDLGASSSAAVEAQAPPQPAAAVEAQTPGTAAAGRSDAGAVEAQTPPARSATARPEGLPLVYSRRRRGARGAAAPTTPGEASPTSPAQTFIAGVTRPVSRILSRPTVHRRLAKRLPLDFAPRRSARLAKKKVDNNTTAEARRTRLSLIKHLGVATDSEIFRPHDIDALGRLFREPLSQAHIAALTALFGWSVPCENQVPWDLEGPTSADGLLGLC